MSSESTRTLIGVVAADRIVAGLVGGGRICGAIRQFPPVDESDALLASIPATAVASAIAELVHQVAAENQVPMADIAGIGIGFPGLIRDGIVEESPNLGQMKGCNLQKAVLDALGATVRVAILNDADAVAAGFAATRGRLNHMTRVWTLGRGIGYGQYPALEGFGEGGHAVVTLDPKEQYCGCGGVGHLEGIMGTRAMRKRFLDKEPDEVFAAAREGDERCAQFVQLWHRALAAATANSIHFGGPGRFYICGPNARFVDVGLLSRYLHDMVKMTPLQGSLFEVAPADDAVTIIGATVGL